MVGLGVDLDDAVLVRPAVAVDVFAVLHHLFGRAALHRHVRHLNVTGYFVFLRIDDEDAVVPQLGDVGFLIREEVDIARRGEVFDASHLLEGVQVDGEDDVGVVHHHPALAVVDAHRLRHVAELHAVGAEKDFVLHRFGRGVVVAECGVAVLEIALVGDEQSCSGGIELLHRIAVVPLHAGGERQRHNCAPQQVFQFVTGHIFIVTVNPRYVYLTVSIPRIGRKFIVRLSIQPACTSRLSCLGRWGCSHNPLHPIEMLL